MCASVNDVCTLSRFHGKHTKCDFILFMSGMFDIFSNCFLFLLQAAPVDLYLTHPLLFSVPVPLLVNLGITMPRMPTATATAVAPMEMAETAPTHIHTYKRVVV